jgi:hypothetical protein
VTGGIVWVIGGSVCVGEMVVVVASGGSPPTSTIVPGSTGVMVAVPSAIVSVVAVATTRFSPPNGKPASSNHATSTSPTITAGTIHQVLRRAG